MRFNHRKLLLSHHLRLYKRNEIIDYAGFRNAYRNKNYDIPSQCFYSFSYCMQNCRPDLLRICDSYHKQKKDRIQKHTITQIWSNVCQVNTFGRQALAFRELVRFPGDGRQSAFVNELSVEISSGDFCFSNSIHRTGK